MNVSEVACSPWNMSGVSPQNLPVWTCAGAAIMF